jgi:hypothetical protein
MSVSISVYLPKPRLGILKFFNFHFGETLKAGLHSLFLEQALKSRIVPNLKHTT